MVIQTAHMSTLEKDVCIMIVAKDQIKINIAIYVVLALIIFV
jgi:hypothetical protein